MDEMLLKDATIEQLKAEIDQRYFVKDATMAAIYRKGQRVKFDAGTKGIIEGMIERVNQKTLKIKPNRGGSWRVAFEYVISD